MNEQLRDYQQEMLDRLHGAWRQTKSVMVQMPTGTGKTHLMAAVIRENMAQGVLIVAHRVELIGQISQTLEAFGVEHGMIDRWTKDVKTVFEENRVVVASVQTLSRRIDTIADNHMTTVIIDEAHHAVAKTYRLLWDKWPEAKFLGLTATPCRLNGTGFTDLFDRLLESYPIQAFIDRGWLSDFEYVSVTPDNWMVEKIAGLKKRGVDGDYQTKEMATVMDAPESIEHLYQSYMKFARGKKGIVYAISREHAQHIADYYVKQGVRCCWIEATTPAEERQRLVDAYRQGDMDVIVNVDIFSEGFDCPEVEFIQLARPTLSLSKYLQQVGRGMRPVARKDYVVILDQVGMYQTFGMPTEERAWELMFRGKVEGKGRHGGDRGYVIRDEGNELTLLNLEMVRIKRHGEKHIGLEIFMKNGRYGVLNDGKVTCKAEFEHIRRIKDSDFFAMATYPYAVFRSKTTIISLTGIDLRAALYGKVIQHGEVFEGESITGQRTFWDSVGMQYYSSRPEFETVGGVDMVKVNGNYMPRKKSYFPWKPVAKEDIWYNRNILWMKHVVIVKKTGKIYPVKAYGLECFYVENPDRAGSLLRIEFDGQIFPHDLTDANWQYLDRVPSWGNARLIHASSGEMEYLDEEYKKKTENIRVFHEV
ncbi:MAG: DEAD/DEAH box helicase [Prevotella sp.]|nr:DEAD/DEAH box helicase [Prevotella sp.]